MCLLVYRSGLLKLGNKFRAKQALSLDNNNLGAVIKSTKPQTIAVKFATIIAVSTPTASHKYKLYISHLKANELHVATRYRTVCSGSFRSLNSFQCSFLARTGITFPFDAKV